MSPLVFVGIDVSQARLDIAVRPGSSFSLAHNGSAIATLIDQLRALSPPDRVRSDRRDGNPAH